MLSIVSEESSEAVIAEGGASQIAPDGVPETAWELVSTRPVQVCCHTKGMSTSEGKQAPPQAIAGDLVRAF